jgi:hypothetical protein
MSDGTIFAYAASYCSWVCLKIGWGFNGYVLCFHHLLMNIFWRQHSTMFRQTHVDTPKKPIGLFIINNYKLCIYIYIYLFPTVIPMIPLLHPCYIPWKSPDFSSLPALKNHGHGSIRWDWHPSPQSPQCSSPSPRLNPEPCHAEIELQGLHRFNPRNFWKFLPIASPKKIY